MDWKVLHYTAWTMQIETLIGSLLSDNVTEVCSLQTSLAQMMKAYPLRQRSSPDYS